MTEKEGVFNSFKVIADRIDEDWDSLTNAQVKALQVHAQMVWATLERRQQERRK